MTKKELVKAIHEVHGGISYLEAQDLLDTMIRILKEQLARGEKITLSGFGVFQVNHRKARKIRDLKTGALIEIRALNYLSFHLSRQIKVRTHEEQGTTAETLLQNRRSMQAGRS